ncbi:MAG: hypothetical protein AAFY42_13305 [Pseudomonadota bacterium]
MSHSTFTVVGGMVRAYLVSEQVACPAYPYNHAIPFDICQCTTPEMRFARV